ncbi:hypothetical protein H359_0492 [Chlamydia ibidis 10-1398/6]|uniref:Inner membrane protein n=1 Tax=Chlamydia ibidis 10-1398/6 TaxID=1046581 RepID=A0ABP2XE19_9CHLA|nr:hypothetical protein H359_0492 [Chlamydia ibidis 10-1398/6]
MTHQKCIGSQYISPEGIAQSRGRAIEIVMVISMIFLMGVIALLGGICSASIETGVLIASIGAVLSVISFSIARLAIEKSKEKKLLIPEKFSNILQVHYPEVFSEVIKNNKVTIKEVREILSYVDSIKNHGNISEIHNSSLRKKFRDPLLLLDRVRSYNNAQPYVHIDNVILQNCPLYWLSKFISLGRQDSLTSHGIVPTPKTMLLYWTSTLGLPIRCNRDYFVRETIFNTTIYEVVKKLTYEQFNILENFVHRNAWNDCKVNNIINSLLGDGDQVDLNNQTLNDLQSKVTSMKNYKNILLLTILHGFSWNQLQMIKALDVDKWDFWCWLDRSADYRGGVQIFGRYFLNHFMNEDSPHYNPGVSLTTYEELLLITRQSREQKTDNLRGVRDVCVHLQKKIDTSMPVESNYAYTSLLESSSFPRYVVDLNTGARSYLLK